MEEGMVAAVADERTKVSGGCACGEIRFGFYEPVARETACYCRACQYASGGGPSYALSVKREQFRVTRGRPFEFATLSEAGNVVTRVFCATCGTHLYAVSDADPEVCSIAVGALDDPSTFKPRQQLWLSEAQPWHRKYRLARRHQRNAPGARRRKSAG